MQNRKKLFALLLALAMIFSMAACGKDSASSAAPAASAAEVPETPAEPTAQTPVEPAMDSAAELSAAEPEADRLVITYPLFEDMATFTLWTSNSPDLSEIISSLNEYLVFEQLEKITNVRWDCTPVSFFSAQEQFQLMVASQDYTDVVCRALDDMMGYTGGADQAIEEEFLIDHSSLIAENMPNLLLWFETYPELRKQLTTVEGNIGGFPKIFKEPGDVTSGGCIRRDWLEELNLEAPKTYDELHDVLVAFKEKKNASVPLVLSAQTGVQSDLLNGMNIATGFFQVDGQVKFGPMQPEFKDYLTMMNKWYQEGLVSDSFLSSTTDVLMDFDTILSGNTGVWYGTGVQSITQLLSMATESQAEM